jgi:hypothetical protein
VVRGYAAHAGRTGLLRYWNPQCQQYIPQWTAEAGITTTQETLVTAAECLPMRPPATVQDWDFRYRVHHGKDHLGPFEAAEHQQLVTQDATTKTIATLRQILG